ncbi:MULTISPECIES: glycosyl hydrolase family 18 protein [unclassified Bacillus (in: firmicutes)]|uniref:glycosyl hydrolase family 18 protein n=1 Tax=unclassified Bacillus (in: firmicutes) TaxID=185979 RepID=UPI0008EA9F45|nr:MULTISPECIES: glycosyl hydrolase family 18 protein [unclassified Bacillus (in: firmicutes)]SFA89204.1 Copper amine oxidase N-terminal domain-containing protein [Bacillus sp. UNCCL13]SFQ84822.1 Copper amine oxidase N-terminal domain-containing protein [Bacillus sp. cl95]
MANIEYTRKKSNTGWVIGGAIIFVALSISLLLTILYPFASTEKTAYFTGKSPILYKGKQVGNAFVEGETVYIPVSFLTNKLDKSIIVDQKSSSIIVTTKDKVIQMPVESLTYYVNAKPVDIQIPIAKFKDQEWYIAIDPLLSFYPIQYKQLKETGAILIQQSGEKTTNALVNGKEVNLELLRLRSEPTLQSPYVANSSYKEEITIENETGDFYFVRKSNGIAGYLQKEYVDKKGEITISIEHPDTPAKLTKINGPIHLTWEAVYTKNPNHALISEMSGVNVVSPTWFKLNNKQGGIANLASLDYSKWAKGRGYQVWGLFSNDFNPEMTHEAFKDFETRQTIIRQLLHFAQMYELDGINFDIENVAVKDGPFVTQLLREATPYLHAAGLTVSMDITFISGSGNWSAFYERDELSKIVDYMVVMAYDEHWGSSPVAGSVASLPWVEEHLQKLLQVVPNERLILGVPLYTRLWKEEQLEDGQVKVTSEALSMSKAKEWIASKGITPVYDDASGQNYVEFYSEQEKITYKIWIEDELSLGKRAELSKKYSLAGIATWSRYFADETAWVALRLDEQKDVTKK